MDSLNSNHIKLIAISFASGACITYLSMKLFSTNNNDNKKKQVSKSSSILLNSTSSENLDTPETFQTAGTHLLDWIINYRKECRDLPVVSTVKHNYLKDILPKEAPENSESWNNIFDDLSTKIVPGLTNWQASNKFFAYFKPHSSYPAVLAETLCAGLNVMGFDWIASPACTELEVVTLDWLATILNLPEKFKASSPGPGGSVIQGSAGESAIVVLLAACLRKASNINKSKNDGTCRRDKMAVFASDQTHTIIKKACRILGLHYVEVPSKLENNWAISTYDMEDAILKSKNEGGYIPLAIVGTPGTTSSCAFDNLSEIGKLAKKYNLWFHVDAAYGGAYAALPEMKMKFNGVDLCDSFCVNAHKKILCPFDLSALYVADRHHIMKALSVESEYLKNDASDSGAVVDYENWQLPLGRRFRALKLWFVLRRFGANGIRKHVRKGIEYRKTLENLIEQDTNEMFEIAAPPSLSLICFRLKNRSEAEHKLFLKELKQTGDCFIIHTKLGGKIVLRIACGGIEQTEDDVINAWNVISKLAYKLF